MVIKAHQNINLGNCWKLLWATIRHVMSLCFNLALFSCVRLICRETYLSFIDKMNERRVALVLVLVDGSKIDDIFKEVKSPSFSICFPAVCSWKSFPAENIKCMPVNLIISGQKQSSSTFINESATSKVLHAGMTALYTNVKGYCHKVFFLNIRIPLRS